MNLRNVADSATQHHILEDQNVLWTVSSKASCIRTVFITIMNYLCFYNFHFMLM